MAKRKRQTGNTRSGSTAADHLANSATDLESDISDALLGAQKDPGLATPCRIHLHSRRHRLTDADGLSGKAVLDGLVAAGILPDDSPAFVRSVTFSQEKIPKSEVETTTIDLIAD